MDLATFNIHVGKYTLRAEVEEDLSYTNIVLMIENGPILDDETFLITELMPAIKMACLQGIQDVEVIETAGIPEEDFCDVDELFEAAKRYGIIEEEANFLFSAN